MTVYPLQKLIDACRGSEDALRRSLSVSGSEWQRWKRHGLTADQCDTFACRAGFNPMTVWPELTWDTIARVEGTQEPSEVLARVRCLDCGRPLVTWGSPVIESPAKGTVKGSCPAGHCHEVTVLVGAEK